MRFRIFVMALWVAGCSTFQNPATGQFESVLISTPAEVSLGQMAAAQVQAQMALAPKPPAAYVQRVQTIGSRIAAVADRRDISYRYHVVPDSSVNAFTMFGGDIYVFTGLIEKSNDDELACVLAHETGHAVARHGVKALQASLGYSLLMQAAFQGKSTVATQVIDTGFDLIRNGFSRKDELQADLLAVRYAKRAGYDPNGMVTFLQKLQKEHGAQENEATVYWRTHPLYKDRIAQAQAEITRLNAAQPPKGSP